MTSLAGCADRPASNYEPGTDETTLWRQPAYDAGSTAYVPDAAAPREGVEARWSTDVDGVSRPVADRDLVLVVADGDLVALDVDAGEERWRSTVGEFYAPPAMTGESVYATTRDGPGLVALDRGDGSVRWQVETRSDVVASPSFDPTGGPRGRPHRLYVGDWSGQVYGVTPEGEVVHTTDVFGPVRRIVGDHRSVLVGAGAEVYAFDVTDDRLVGKWRRSLPGPVRYLARDEDGNVFASAGDVVKLGGRTTAGEPQWRSESGGLSLAVTPHHVFTGQATLAAVDPGSGDVHWSFDRPVDAAPAVAGDTVYAGEPGGFTAFKVGGGFGLGADRFGVRRWHHSTEGLPVGGIAVVEGALVGVTMLPNDPDGPRSEGPDGRVHVLDPA